MMAMKLSNKFKEDLEHSIRTVVLLIILALCGYEGAVFLHYVAESLTNYEVSK